MTSLLSEPWIEDRVVFALLFHRHKMKPQDTKAQIAQVISVRLNKKTVALSDGKYSIETFYDNVDGSLQNEKLVRLKNWTITTRGNLGISRHKDDICIHVVNLEVIGGQGMGIVGKPQPIEESIEVRRVLDSWKYALTSALLQHDKPLVGDVRKWLQDTQNDYSTLQQYMIQSTNTSLENTPLDPQSTETSKQTEGDETNDAQRPESPPSRKRPLPENQTSPNLLANMEGDERNDNLSENSDKECKEMSISHMLVAEDDDEKGESSHSHQTQSPQRMEPKLMLDDIARSNVNSLLKLWWETTQQSTKHAESKRVTEGLLLQKWLSWSKEEL